MKKLTIKHESENESMDVVFDGAILYLDLFRNLHGLVGHYENENEMLEDLNKCNYLLLK